ncbi:MAG TPA: hypothetical protein VGK67_14605 [Myxococcales bacterium]
MDAAGAADADPPLDAAGPAVDAGTPDALPFPLAPYPAVCAVGVLDSFETAAEVARWQCSNWATATLDPSGNPFPVSTTSTGATEGSAALSVPVRFTGAGYEQGYVGRAVQLSLAGCASLSLDVTLPADAPSGLRGLVVLLVGPTAAFSAQETATPLEPGATTTVTLQLSAGIDPVPSRDGYADLRGVGLKIEGSAVTFSGAISIDRVRTSGLAPPSPADTGARPVGTFGGFVRASGTEVPARNGFLTYGADSTVQGHALRWAKLGPSGGDFVVGRAYFGVTLPSPSSPSLVFHDWSLLEARQEVLATGTATALMSRAFPAVRYSSPQTRFSWATAEGGRAPLSRMAVVENGKITVHALDSSSNAIPLSAMSEPWILLWGAGAGWSFEVPMLLTFEKRPVSATPSGTGLDFDFGASTVGRVNVMPLGGVRRRALGDTASWDQGLPGEVIVQSRAWVPILAAFPTSLAETYSLDEAAGTVTVEDRFSYETYQDPWGTVPTPIATIPPVVLYAGSRGYPVSYPDGSPTRTEAATWYGPFAHQPGPVSRFTLPLPGSLTHLPIALRVEGEPAAAAVRNEMERLLRDDVPDGPGTYWLNNDLADAQFLCDAWATLLPESPERRKARDVGTRLVENTFLARNLSDSLEPVTGQRYSSPLGHSFEYEPFDREWFGGRQLAALARCSEAIDLDVARGAWPKVLALYRYDRIFMDWATGSVLSSCMGFTQLADGMHFAWDGMLGVARLARKLGDEETFRDAAYRSARQQLALHDAWLHAEWVRDIDYGVGHVGDAKIPADQVETRGAIDGWVEDFGAATLEFRSFWQTTNFLYFDLPAQLSLYRHSGLEARVRTLEYEIMPALHPAWTDGNVLDPVDGRYYGSNYTAAHLAARALLFHDDPQALFGVYQGVEGTAVASEWYTMRWHGIAGPTLLALERGHAPVVEAPVGAVRVAWAQWDAASGAVAVDFQALRDGAAVFRTRAPGGEFIDHPVEVRAGQRSQVTLVP